MFPKHAATLVRCGVAAVAPWDARAHEVLRKQANRWRGLCSCRRVMSSLSIELVN